MLRIIWILFFLWFSNKILLAQTYSIMAQDLLYAVKTQDSVAAQNFFLLLEKIPEDSLVKELNAESIRKAFWLNVYNATVQWALQKNPSEYAKRARFYRKKRVWIAGHGLSLDEIEHGLIRKSKVKWGLGYVQAWFVCGFERRFRMDSADMRIHFALNCGAKSCPAVSYYDAARLDEDLSGAMFGYFKQEVRFDSVKNVVYVPILCLWFRGDFGGKKGVYSYLESNGFIPKGKRPKMEYIPYDWSLQVGNYSEK